MSKFLMQHNMWGDHGPPLSMLVIKTQQYKRFLFHCHGNCTVINKGIWGNLLAVQKYVNNCTSVFPSTMFQMVYPWGQGAGCTPLVWSLALKLFINLLETYVPTNCSLYLFTDHSFPCMHVFYYNILTNEWLGAFCND